MKERLLEKAKELAREYRRYHELLYGQRGNAEPSLTTEEIAELRCEALWRLFGFGEALALIDEISPEDVRGIFDSVIAELDPSSEKGTVPPAEFLNYIKGLDQLDDFGHKE